MPFKNMKLHSLSLTVFELLCRLKTKKKARSNCCRCLNHKMKHSCGYPAGNSSVGDCTLSATVNVFTFVQHRKVHARLHASFCTAWARSVKRDLTIPEGELIQVKVTEYSGRLKSNTFFSQITKNCYFYVRVAIPRSSSLPLHKCLRRSSAFIYSNTAELSLI